MRIAGDLDYACARIHARFGNRPDALAWRRIESIRELPAMLDAARATSLGRWTAGIAAGMEPHALEAVMRSHWRTSVGDVAAWMPAEWQPPVAWCATLADLPLLHHLGRREPMPAWSALDTDAGDVSRVPVRLAAVAGDPEVLLRAWHDEWRRRLPRSADSQAPLLAELEQCLRKYRAAMRDAFSPDASMRTQALRERVERIYRRAVVEPTLAFAYLTLTALDLARFRGEVLRRALFSRISLVR